MSVSVHVAADQTAQWWDACVCIQSRRLRRIAPISRYYMSLLALEASGILKRTSEGDENDFFGLPDEAPEWWKKPSLDRIRRTFDEPEDVSSRNMKLYIEAMNKGMARSKNVKEGARVVSGFINLIAQGDIEVIGWDAAGLLEFRATERVAEQIGMSQGVVFLSAVGQYPGYSVEERP
jgi:hypothetical protein